MTTPSEQRARRFREKFVKMTDPSTIGSSRSKMVKPVEILNVRKPHGILQFLEEEVRRAVEEARKHFYCEYCGCPNCQNAEKLSTPRE